MAPRTIVQQLTFTEHLLDARHCARLLVFMISLNLQTGRGHTKPIALSSETANHIFGITQHPGKWHSQNSNPRLPGPEAPTSPPPLACILQVQWQNFRPEPRVVPQKSPYTGPTCSSQDGWVWGFPGSGSHPQPRPPGLTAQHRLSCQTILARDGLGGCSDGSCSELRASCQPEIRTSSPCAPLGAPY